MGSARRDGRSDRIRWAPRLPPRWLERLYRADAERMPDEELCEAVGFRLFERCRAFVLVHRSEVDCPRCGASFRVVRRGTSGCPAACGWSTTDAIYRQSLRDHTAFPGRAIAAFERFHRRYPAARSYRARLLLIDELIHSFHLHEKTDAPVKSVASKLLEGNKTEAVQLLDRLSALDPEQKERWRQRVGRTLHARLVERDP